MRAELRVAVAGGRVVELVTTPPLGAKVLPGPELVLVGTAASLLEGDRLRICCQVGAGQRLTIRSVAAQLALPCPGGGTTRLDVDAVVGPGAELTWRPEPLVAAAGARHRSSARLWLAAGAGALWVDEVVLGRSGDAPSTVDLRTRLQVDHDGRPLWRDGLDTTVPGFAGPAVAAGARYLGTAARLGRATASGDPPSADGWLPLAGDGLVTRVVDADPLRGRQQLACRLPAPL